MYHDIFKSGFATLKAGSFRNSPVFFFHKPFETELMLMKSDYLWLVFARKLFFLARNRASLSLVATIFPCFM